MFKPLSLLLCSLITLSLTSITTLAALQVQKAGPFIPRLLGYQKRQVDDGSSPTTTDTASDTGTQIETFSTETPSSTATTNTMMMYALGNPVSIAAAPDSSSASTVTSVFTASMALTTVTSTITTTTTDDPQTPATEVTVTVPASPSTATVYVTVTPTDSQPSPTIPITTASASDCAGLNIELGGLPYTAPMGHQYNLQCRSFYYTDDDNTISTNFNISSYRACADLCDQDDNCNLYFWGNENAGDQYQECFLLSSDIYGQNPNSDLADAGVKVGYVSQAMDK